MKSLYPGGNAVFEVVINPFVDPVDD